MAEFAGKEKDKEKMKNLQKQRLMVVDSRTGKKYELPIENRSIWAVDLKQIKVDDDDRGLYSHDPAFLNTTSCKSSITFIDGEKGILLYRGYPIEELAERKHYLEVAYLLIYGELPSRSQHTEWQEEIKRHLRVNPAVNHMMRALPKSSHPMPMLVSAIAAFSCLNSEARNV